VSKGQALAKLEALLARVRQRADEPRSATVVAVASTAEVDEPVEAIESSRRGPTRTEADIVVEVEVQATTQETVVAVPVEEVSAPAALESRERLVAAEPAPPPAAEPEAAASAELELEPSPVVTLPIDEAVDELVPDLAPEPEEEQAEQTEHDEPNEQEEQDEQNEHVEEAPVSSRRPVAPPPEQRLDEMAFGSVEPAPPRHTPPPESGRLPAAPEVEFEGDITGVRDAARSAHPAAVPTTIAIVPAATLVELAPSDQVADVVSPAPAPEPTTFVGVLDQSLAL
jgi:hypothetical protein